jgi:hypothetical protein
MVGRDDPRVFTKSGLRDLIGDVESLSQAGYESGDILPVLGTVSNEKRTISTSATSYTDVGRVGESTVQFGAVLDPDNTYVALGARLVPGSGEEVYCRWNNNNDNEQVGPEVSTDTPKEVWSGWSKYNPTTTDSPVLLKVQGKTDPGANASSIRTPILYLGVQL